MTVTLDELLAWLPAEERAAVEERSRELVAEAMRLYSLDRRAGADHHRWRLHVIPHQMPEDVGLRAGQGTSRRPVAPL
jgi:hypothetical protein